MLLHGPVGSLVSVEYLVGVVNVLLELAGHLPLRIILLIWRCRDVPSRQDLASVLEDGASPPLELPVLCGRQATNKGSCIWVLAAVKHVATG